MLVPSPIWVYITAEINIYDKIACHHINGQKYFAEGGRQQSSTGTLVVVSDYHKCKRETYIPIEAGQ